MATSWWLPWLVAGLFLAHASSPALAKPQDAEQGGDADAEPPTDVESDIESPVSNPDIRAPKRSRWSTTTLVVG